jgi:chitinase
MVHNYTNITNTILNIANAKNHVVKALVLTERGGQHEGFVVAALDWLSEFGKTHNFTITECNHASEITENFVKMFGNAILWATGK